MFPNDSTTYRLRCMLENDSELRQMMLCSLERAAEHNPDMATNPVRTLDDLYKFLDIFITSMPWQAVENFSGTKDTNISLFRRIDQTIGYFYYLFDQPLEELKDKGYVFPSLQYEPRIAQWILQYNSMWGLYLSSEKSWNNEYLQQVSADPLFGLQHGWYESPDNWHSFNDFFARRLSSPDVRPIADSCLVAPCDGEQMPWLPIDSDGNIQADTGSGIPIKTTTAFNISPLVPSEYCEFFKGGMMTHVVLDMYNYHHVHSPADGTLTQIMHYIEYAAHSGGHIVWDATQHRYRYEQTGVLDFQPQVPRKTYIIKTAENGYVALVAVSVAQVGKFEQAENIFVGSHVQKGTDLGHFLCGSDVLILISKDYKISKISKIPTPILMGQALLSSPNFTQNLDDSKKM
ncbi:MAG: phosphatidylserine decarboxylase [Paludibacteraceae bacterium]|nr:phosphatidylserine decarboxylase [Paludibacteraceae bacterium]